MKQYTYILTAGIIFCTLLVAVQVHAETATLSAEPTLNETKQKQIDELKERIATKVAQLRQTEKRALYGTIKSTSLTSITLETVTKDVKIELTDSISIAQTIGGKRTKLTIDNLSKNDLVTVFGDYDTTLDILKTKAIYIQAPPPLLVYGTVTDMNKKDFTITISTTQGQSYTIDIEKVTKTSAWTREKGLGKTGFSTIIIGDSVHVAGTADPKKDSRISALRMLTLGNLTGAPGPSPTPAFTPTPTHVPSSTSTVTPTAKP